MILLVWFLYAVAAACGLLAALWFGKAVYHQWSRRGTASGVLVNTFLSFVSGLVGLAAVYLATLLDAG